MTNIENTPEATDNFDHVEFVDAVPSFTTDLTVIATPYRYLNWVASVAAKAYSADLSGFSVERRTAILVFVDHGLVTERRWVSGEQDGRVTYRLTEAGQARLEAAWAAADLVVLG
jgi:hypothetical protein